MSAGSPSPTCPSPHPGFLDGSPHRASLPSAYQSYLATSADPFYKADTEDLQMLLRPLFFTSFLIDVQSAYLDVLGGRVLPKSAHVLSPDQPAEPI